MKTWIYSWIIYPIVFGLASIWGWFSEKVRETLKLRSWKNFLSLRLNAGKAIRYWIHVASAGELEYAMPILRELESRDQPVLITYYSISAKSAVEKLPEQLKNVSLVVPLPHDGLGLMEEFVTLLRKQGVEFLLLLKYELWPGLLWECNRLNIRVFLVDALKPGWFHRRLIHKLSGILSGYVSEIEDVDHPNVKVVGDTRVERVVERAAAHASRQNLPDILVQVESLIARELNRLLVCGSVWPEDAEVILPAISECTRQRDSRKLNVLWVPHEMDETFLKNSLKGFVAAGFQVFLVRSSDDLARISRDSNRPLALIFAVKGVLADLYRLGTLAYVGGGFGDGVHSVWEPALVGAKVACGPKTSRSPESVELQSIGVLSRILTINELLIWLKHALSSDTNAAKGGPDPGDVLKGLLAKHVGAAKRIVDYCEGSRNTDVSRSLGGKLNA